MARLEKRKNIRVQFSTYATLRFPQLLFDGLETRDLSLRGVFVCGVSGVRHGELCQLELHLVGTTIDLRLRMKAEVVRLEADGVGLHFRDIDVDSFAHLRQIVALNSEDPDEVDQELTRNFRPEH